MVFNGVTPVVLGVLSFGPRSGYDIKRLVDKSTRFFWAASYSQIYPELRRLEQNGLIQGKSAPTGGRRRKVYRLTAAGEGALREWLLAPGFTDELRHEGLLKLFFAGVLAPDEALGIVRAIRRREEEGRERLLAIEPLVKVRGGFPYVVLQSGLASTGCMADWAAETERRLAAELKGERNDVPAAG